MSLFLVPLPIGNLQDITLRAIEILKTVDFIVAEDTRYSLKLLNHLGIKKRLVSYYKPKEREKAAQIVKELVAGRGAALITDSGTPGISDPGFILVGEAINAGVDIQSLPGPTAFVPALVASGIDPSRFLFLGFPPRKAGLLKAMFKEILPLPYTLIFYESPRRVAAFLDTAAAVLGDRPFALVKELSKKHEKIIRGSLASIDEILKKESLLGEMVIIIGGQSEEERSKATSVPQLETIDDLFTFFKDHHNISKNQIKQIIMTRS